MAEAAHRPCHPGIKVAVVLALGLGVAAGRGWSLLFSMLPAGLALAVVPGAGRAFAGLARRLRWVFLFVVVLHGWFTPGLPVWDALGAFAPSEMGLKRAAELVAIILIMVALVAALVRSTASFDLAAGIAWLLAPLGYIGVPAERFGRLLAWTLDRVEAVQREGRGVRDALRLRFPERGSVGQRLRREAATVRVVLQRAQEAADRNAEALFLRSGGAPAIQSGAPPVRDWGLLVAALAWTALVLGMGAGR